MLRHIIRNLTVAVCALLLLPACQAGKDEVPAAEGMEFQMIVRIPLGSGQQTRADYNTDYYDGQGNIADGEYEGLDYTLVEGDLSILCYDAQTGAFVEEAQIGSMQRTPSTQWFVEYRVRGRFTQILNNDQKVYRIVALSNLKGMLPAANYQAIRATESALYAGLTFGYDKAHDFTLNNWESAQPGSTLPTSARVPMWGKATAQLSSAEVVDITMLRALAKVRVELSDQLKTKGFSITGIQLVNPNNKGFVAPVDAAKATRTSERTALNTAINIPADAAPLATPQQFYEGKHALAGKWYTYLPETKNTGVAAELRPYMVVTMSNTNGDTYSNFRLEFGDYEPVSEGGTDYQGTLFDVQRNHYYMYRIVGVTPLELKYEICNWSERLAPDIVFN